MHLVAQHNGVGQAQHRRPVENDVLRAAHFQQIHQLAQARAGQQVHRAGRNRPGGNDHQVVDGAHARNLARLAVARQVVRQTRRVGQVHVLVHRGVAHVGVHQHHLGAHLRKVDGQRQRRGRLALVLGGTGQHQAARRAVGRGELQRRAHRAVGLGHLPARVFVHQQCQAGNLGVVLHLGNHAQQRHLQQLFYLVGKLDRIVHRLHQEHNAQPQHNAGQQPNGGVQRQLGLVGEQRHLGLVHHLDVVGFHPAGHAHFFYLLQQAVVQLAVGVHFALEQVEIHAAVLGLHDLTAGLLQPGANQVLLPLGHLCLVAHRSQNALHFGFDSAVELVDLRAQLLHLGEVVFVDLGRFLVVLIQLADLGFVVLNRLALKHLARRIGGRANRLVVRIGLDHFLLGLGQSRGIFGKRLV